MYSNIVLDRIRNVIHKKPTLLISYINEVNNYNYVTPTNVLHM